jgi:hypothetical protein
VAGLNLRGTISFGKEGSGSSSKDKVVIRPAISRPIISKPARPILPFIRHIIKPVTKHEVTAYKGPVYKESAKSTKSIFNKTKPKFNGYQPKGPKFSIIKSIGKFKGYFSKTPEHRHPQLENKSPQPAGNQQKINVKPSQQPVQKKTRDEEIKGLEMSGFRIRTPQPAARKADQPRIQAAGIEKDINRKRDMNRRRLAYAYGMAKDEGKEPRKEVLPAKKETVKRESMKKEAAGKEKKKSAKKKKILGDLGEIYNG